MMMKTKHLSLSHHHPKSILLSITITITIITIIIQPTSSLSFSSSSPSLFVASLLSVTRATASPATEKMRLLPIERTSTMATTTSIRMNTISNSIMTKRTTTIQRGIGAFCTCNNEFHFQANNKMYPKYLANTQMKKKTFFNLGIMTRHYHTNNDQCHTTRTTRLFCASTGLGLGLGMGIGFKLNMHTSSNADSSTSTTNTLNEINKNDNNKPQNRHRHRQISFITDVEGDANYFDRFVENSNILEFEYVKPCFDSQPKKEHDSNIDFFPYNKRVIFRKLNNNHDQADNNNDYDNHPHPMLVCGGDMWDKGGGDLYVTRQLLSLQERYGKDHVHFILGNRDINKMRILQELGIETKEQGDDNDDDGSSSSSSKRSNALPFHGGVYWLKGSGLVGDTDLIAKAQSILTDEKQHTTKHDDDDNSEENLLPEKYAQVMVPSSSAADRLKWMLKKTMGSPDAFELRRSELKDEKLFRERYHDEKNQKTKNRNDEKKEVQITDEDVVASYKSSTHPIHGAMGRYLSQGKLALCLGGAMFLHGSLPFAPPMVKKYMHHYNEDKIKDCNNDDGDDDDDNNNHSGDNKNNKEGFPWSEFYTYALPFVGKDKLGFEVDSDAIHSTTEWVDLLNSFAYNQTEAWKRNITAREEGIANLGENDITITTTISTSSMETIWCSLGGYENSSSDGSLAFGSLLQYGMGWLPFPDRLKNPTVVYDSWITNGLPRRFYEKDELDLAYTKMVYDFFNHSNLDVIITGHQPGTYNIVFLFSIPKLYFCSKVMPFYIVLNDLFLCSSFYL